MTYDYLNKREARRLFLQQLAAAGTAAINALNGKQVQGRALTVNEARAREERPRQFAGSRR